MRAGRLVTGSDEQATGQNERRRVCSAPRRLNEFDVDFSTERAKMPRSPVDPASFRSDNGHDGFAFARMRVPMYVVIRITDIPMAN
jgi:hypothetical protein